MRIYFISGLKGKLNFVLRIIIIVALLVFFIMKLWEVVSNDIFNLFEEDKPSGNPLRVEEKEGFNYKVVEYE